MRSRQAVHDFVITALDYLAKSLSISDTGSLPGFCINVEEELRNAVRVAIVGLLKSFAIEEDIDFKTIGDHEFRYFGRRFLVSTRDRDRTLIVEVQSFDQDGGRLTSKASLERLYSLGRYNRVEVHVDRQLARYQELIAAGVAATLQRVYERVKVEIDLVLRTDVASLVRDLYDQLRGLIAEPVLSHIWLSLTVQGTTRYLVDEANRNTALARAADRRHLPDAPLVLLTDLLTTTVPFDVTFSKEAIAADQILLFPFSNARYGRHELTESIVYEADDHFIQPIRREGKFILTAAYPPEVLIEAEPILSRRGPDLARVLESHSSLLRSLGPQPHERQYGSLAGNIAFWAGRFVRGVVEE